MARTTIMRAQSDAANAMLDRILIAIDAYRGDASASPLSLELARLAAVLRMHFALGERSLYPFMFASGQPQTAEIARGFQHEVSQLALRFDRFNERWSSSSAIASDMAQFRCEAEAMISAIRERLRRDTRDLFPLADALADRFNAVPEFDRRRAVAAG
ncbi:MAG: hemerythrin domain-containing protein [Sphingomonas bacterium]|nr:hemerythrin domain-containing protein [Sphingomonas bacterium]